MAQHTIELTDQQLTAIQTSLLYPSEELNTPESLRRDTIIDIDRQWDHTLTLPGKYHDFVEWKRVERGLAEIDA